MRATARLAAGLALATACLALGSVGAAHAQSRVTPPDPATLHPTVRAAVAELARIVERRDLAALKRHLPADAKISFGGDAGPEGLDTVWEPQRADTLLWHELETILALGGVQSAQDHALTWCAPWPSCQDIDAGTDVLPFDFVVVTGTSVAVRARPDEKAALLDRVGRQTLVLAEGDDTGAWWHVRWKGSTGYVRSDLARSPIDHRLSLRATPDAWTIDWFVAGD